MNGYLVMTRHRKDDVPVKLSMDRGSAFALAKDLHKRIIRGVPRKRTFVSKIPGYAWGSARASDIVAICVVEFRNGIPFEEILSLPVPSVRKQSDDPK